MLSDPYLATWRPRNLPPRTLSRRGTYHRDHPDDGREDGRGSLDVSGTVEGEAVGTDAAH
jgi:hypothetical protein